MGYGASSTRHSLDFFYCLASFLRQGLMLSRLALNLLYSHGWLWTSDHSASPQGLGLQAFKARFPNKISEKLFLSFGSSPNKGNWLPLHLHLSCGSTTGIRKDSYGVYSPRGKQSVGSAWLESLRLLLASLACFFLCRHHRIFPHVLPSWYRSEGEPHSLSTPQGLYHRSDVLLWGVCSAPSMTGSSSSSLGALRVWTGDLLPRENGSEVGLRCLVVKSSCYSCRGVGFDSQQTQLYKTAHNHLVPGGSIAQPGTHVVHKYTCMQTSIYVKGKQINLFLFF